MMQSRPAVMVTAIGALIGQGILRSLRLAGTEYRLIGLDRITNAYGASLCDVCYQKPCVETDPAYLPWLREVIEREHVKLILPGIEEDVFFFHDHRQQMAGWPLQIALNNDETIAAGRDKWLLHERLLQHGLPAIPSVAVSNWAEMQARLGTPPFIAKARRGSGSRGQRIFRSEDDWQQHGNHFNADFMVQKVVGSDEEEYTVGLFGYGDGSSSDLFVFKRRLWNGGTWQAEVVEADTVLTSFCDALTRIFKPIGPTNYQFRKDGAQWLLLEINPRISASTAIRAGFGFNEALLCIEFYLHDKARPNPTKVRHGRSQRYVTEYFDFT